MFEAIHSNIQEMFCAGESNWGIVKRKMIELCFTIQKPHWPSANIALKLC